MKFTLYGLMDMKTTCALLTFFFNKSSLIYFLLSCLLAVQGDLDGHTTEVLLISCFFGLIQMLINFKKITKPKQS